MGAACGSWWSGPLDARGIPLALQIDGSPNGLLVLGIEGNEYHTRWVSSSDPTDFQMRVTFDVAPHDVTTALPDSLAGPTLSGAVARSALPSARAVVNFFGGGPRSRLTMAIDGGEWRPLDSVLRTDPYVEALYARHREDILEWIVARKTTHIWQALLPPDLESGPHTLTVRAIDEYGRTHLATSVLEVVGD